jgi:hypothetical protein
MDIIIILLLTIIFVLICHITDLLKAILIELRRPKS